MCLCLSVFVLKIFLSPRPHTVFLKVDCVQDTIGFYLVVQANVTAALHQCVLGTFANELKALFGTLVHVKNMIMCVSTFECVPGMCDLASVHLREQTTIRGKKKHTHTHTLTICHMEKSGLALYAANHFAWTVMFLRL